MNFQALRDEVKARGFDYLTDTRVGQFVNTSYQELCELMSWPFLETTITGSPPLAITDVRAVLSVTDTTNKTTLAPVDRRNMERIDPTLDEAGQPCAWWLENTTLSVWPTATPNISLSVRYLKVPVDLVATGDTPVVPTRFHDIIVDGAVLRAQKDNDDYGAAQTTQALWQQGVDRMVASLMNRALDRPMFILQTHARDY